MTSAKRIFFTTVTVILLCATAAAVRAAAVGSNAITSVTISKNRDAVAVTATPVRCVCQPESRQKRLPVRAYARK